MVLGLMATTYAESDYWRLQRAGIELNYNDNDDDGDDDDDDDDDDAKT